MIVRARGDFDMRTLDEVLKELNDAEKEYQKKCEEYGIEMTVKKRSKNSKEETGSN